MVWKALRVLLVLAVLTGLAVGGYRFLVQKTAQSNVTKADTTACHTFGKWDKEAHNNQTLSVQSTDQMVTELQHASDGTLKKDADLLNNDFAAQSLSGVQKQIMAIGQRCNYLGLIDANGNPT